MKCLLILALAAAASASADPYMFYSGYYNPLSYSSAFYSPYGYHAVSPGVTHSVLNKRDAEPYYYGALPYTYGHHAYTPSVYAHGIYNHGTYGIKANGGTYSNDAVSPWNYAAKGRYVANSFGATHIAKREAEPFYYGAGYYMPSVYSHGVYAPSVYSHPVAHHVAVPQMKTYSNDAVKPFNYAAKGRYHADSFGAKHIAKREAEPFYYGAGYAAPHVASYNPYTRTSVHVPTTLYKPYSYIKYFH